MSREPLPSLDRIAAALDASEAGRLVPAGEIHAMLQEGIDEIKARLSAENLPKVQRFRP